MPGQVRGGFIKAVVQQEGGIAPQQPVETMEEEAAEISAGGKLTHVLDIALPAHEWRGPEGAVFGAVIDALDPGLEPLVQLAEREQTLGIKIGQGRAV